tara:strand:+ start:64 stop:765 length:702 start_codon:yes stop_codon:yes gene_type:complete
MIILENITKSFGDFEAVKNLSIEITEGEIYGLLGSNGAGKSTTINVLLGFLDPDKGKAFINGIDVTSHADSARKEIGYISENVNLYSYLTGLENLNYFCKIAGEDYNDEHLSKILNDCGLDSYVINKKVGSYSKGMRQKVGIAIAFAKKAKVLLLDEPASGLDPLASTELSITLKSLAEKGTAILMASHDIFRVRETCERIGILKNGILIDQMDTSKVTTNELEKIYIDYMRG